MLAGLKVPAWPAIERQWSKLLRKGRYELRETEVRVVRHLGRPVAVALELARERVVDIGDRKPAGAGAELEVRLPVAEREDPLAREDRAARRDRHHRLGERAVESHALGGQRVDVRCLHLRRAVGADVIRPQAVDDQQQHVHVLARSGLVHGTAGGGQQGSARRSGGASLKEPTAVDGHAAAQASGLGERLRLHGLRDPDQRRAVRLRAVVQAVDDDRRPGSLVRGRVVVVGEVEAERHGLRARPCRG